MMARIFKRGLIAIAPLAATLALVEWLFSTLEGVFSIPIKALIGPQYYFKGMGIAVALVFIFLIGSVINNWIIQKISAVFERLLKAIPLVKTLYNSICEMMGYFGSKQQHNKGAVVLVEIAGLKLIGLVTRESFSELADGIADEGDIAVFFPLSYQIGGHTVIISKSKVKRLDMSVEDGMRFCVTAGVLAQPGKSTQITP